MKQLWSRDEQIAAARGLIKLKRRKGQEPSSTVLRIAAEPMSHEKKAAE
ncbi:hypothetical protein ICV35_23835 [Rhodococcus ruber]|nr:hypothetical protein [Rhodococcus ruber]MBD8056683.1 hypothetical protein [Rhodococcus ruber]